MSEQKEIKIVAGNYGEAFFLGDKLLAYVHENDGCWRDEYFNPILLALGYKVMRVKEPNKTHAKAIAEYEP